MIKGPVLNLFPIFQEISDYVSNDEEKGIQSTIIILIRDATITDRGITHDGSFLFVPPHVYEELIKCPTAVFEKFLKEHTCSFNKITIINANVLRNELRVFYYKFDETNCYFSKTEECSKDFPGDLCTCTEKIAICSVHTANEGCPYCGTRGTKTKKVKKETF